MGNISKIKERFHKGEPVKLTGQPDQEAILGGIRSYLSSFEEEMANGLLAIVTGNTTKITGKQLQSKLSSNKKDNVFSKIDTITKNTEEIKQTLNDIKSVLDYGTKTLLYGIADGINKLVTKIAPEANVEQNALNLVLDTTKAQNMESVIDSISNLVKDSKDISMGGLNYLEKFFTRLNTLTSEDGIITKSIENTNNIPILSKTGAKNIGYLKALSSVLEGFMYLDADTIKEHISELTDIFKTIASVLDSVNKMEITKKTEETRKNLAEVKSLYENDIASTAQVINDHSKDLDTIKAGTEKSKEVATSAADIDTTDIERSINNVDEIIRAIASLGLVMIFGGLIMSVYEPLVNASIKFGFTLALFLTELLIPIALLAIVNRYAGKVEAIDDLGRFIIISTGVMILGAAFMFIPGLADKAILFGRTLSTFIISLTLPSILLMVFSKISNLEHLDELSTFVVKATFIMMIGAVFALSNTLVKNSLLFGEYLAMFIGLIIAPVFAYGVRIIFAGKILNNFSQVVLTSTFVMLIGALFIYAGGGKYLWGAIKFGLALNIFMTLIIAPLAFYAVAGGLLAGLAIKHFSKLVITCTIVMLIGSYFMRKKELWMPALGFGLLLSAFIYSILWPIQRFDKAVKKSYKTLFAISMFILISASLFMMGANLMKDRKYVGSGLLFGVVLTLFITGVLLPFKLYKNDLNKSFPVLVKFGIFIIACGVTLALGAVIVDKYGVKAIFAALIISAFIYAMVGAVKWLVGGDGVKGLRKDSVKNAFTLMLAIAGLLLVTSLAISLVAASGADWKTFGILSIMFAIVAGFAYLVIHIVKTSKMTINQVKNATFIIGAVAALLLVTSLAIFIVSRSGADWNTVLILGAMIVITSIVILFTRWVSKSMKKEEVLEATMIIGACTAILLISSLAIWIIANSGATWQTYLITLCLAATVIAMGVLIELIAKINKENALEGAGIMAICAGVLLISAFAISIIANSGANEENVKTLGWISAIIIGMTLAIELISLIPSKMALQAAEIMAISTGLLISVVFAVTLLAKSGVEQRHVWMVGIVALVMVALSGLVMGLGAILANPITSGIFWYGVGAIGAITGIVLVISVALMNIAKAMQLAEKTNVKKGIANTKEVLTEFLGIFKEVEIDKGLKRKVKDINGIIRPITRIISKVARTVADVASLKVAMNWDKNGNPIEWRQLQDNDFKLAANNTKVIITTLALGISQAADYLTGISKKELKKTLYFAKEIGEVIGNISIGLQSYANLMVPIRWNSNGKPIWFEKMTKTHIEEAKDNIATIILAMAEAINNVYKDHPDLFGVSTIDLFGKGIMKININTGSNNFIKVLKGVLLLGEVIGGISTGLQAYANLMIPTNWDPKTGKPIYFKQMTTSDIEAARDNISKIILVMADAIAQVYNDNPGLFDETVKFTGGGLFGMESTPSPFMKVLTASKILSEVILGIAEGVKAFATLQVPDQWNPENGVPTHYVTISGEEMEKAKENLSSILTTMVLGIKVAYDSIKEELKPKKFKRIVEAFAPVGELISNLANGIKDMAALKIATKYNAEGKAIEYKTLTDSEFKNAGTHIKEIMKALVSGVYEGYQGVKGQLQPSALKKIAESFVPIGDFVSSIAKAVLDFCNAEYTMPDGTKKKFTETDFSNVGTNIQKLLSAIINGIVNTYNTQIKPFEENNNLQTIISSLNDITKSIVGLIETFGKSVNVEKINTTAIINNIEAIFGTKDNKDESILNKILSIINQYDNVEELKKGTSVLTLSTEILNSIMDNISNIANALKTFEGIDDAKFATIGSAITTINTNIDSIKNGFKDIKARELSDTLEKAKIFTEIVLSIIEAGNGDITNSKIFTQVSTGIKEINEQVSTIDDAKTKSLTEEVKTLDKFVKLIDKTNLTSVSKITSLMEAMANLADKMGGFDNAIEFLQSEGLMNMVNKVSEAVTEAKNTIDRANQLNATREANFARNLEKLSKVMKQNIKVGVGDIDDDGTITVKDES